MDKLGSSSGEVSLPASITDVHALLAWLRARGGNWETALMEHMVRVTVNRQFAALETSLNNTSEIAIVPVRPG